LQVRRSGWEPTLHFCVLGALSAKVALSVTQINKRFVAATIRQCPVQALHPGCNISKLSGRSITCDLKAWSCQPQMLAAQLLAVLENLSLQTVCAAQQQHV
jgi:hypothetical protein